MVDEPYSVFVVTVMRNGYPVAEACSSLLSEAMADAYSQTPEQEI